MTIPHKAIYVSTIPTELSIQFFTDLGRTNLNFIWKNKTHRMAKAVLNNELLELSPHWISSCTALQNYSNKKPCGTDIKTDMIINGIEMKAQM